MSPNHLLILFFFITASKSILQIPEIPQFPRNSPQYNQYPFCNTSLRIATRAKSLISLLTLQEKIQQLSDNASAIPRLGIPAYEWWSESLRGIATNGPGINFNGTMPSATSFPQVIVTAGSFNKTLWSKIGPAIATEARAMYNYGHAGLTFWAPTINLFRDPQKGERPGEDPMLVSAYAIEYVKSFQSGKWDGEGGDESDDDEGLMLYACCKHLIAMTWRSGKNSVDIVSMLW